jgi:hypothetical protein
MYVLCKHIWPKLLQHTAAQQGLPPESLLKLQPGCRELSVAPLRLDYTTGFAPPVAVQHRNA